jgi:hypothetical protein
MTSTKLYISILIIALMLSSCFSSDTHREEGKIFHAGPMSGGIGALYFGLYNDNTYQICNSGGIGQTCYSGKFKLDKDTLILLDLNKNVPLKSDKLLIVRYNDQDSNYWKWKYSRVPNSWQHLKRQDSINGLGDVYQLDKNNKLMNDQHDEHFIIRLDNLKNYR